MVQLYLLGGSIVLTGFVWFWIVRPIAVAAQDAYLDWQESRADRDDELPARRPRPPLPTRAVMSRVQPIARNVSPQVVSMPVSQYGGMATGMENVVPVAPDIDAENAGMAPVDALRDIMSDEALLALLARQKLANGKYRMSANKIFDLLGGDRNTVLAQIKSVRDTPQFRRTPEQEANRSALGLNSQN